MEGALKNPIEEEVTPVLPPGFGFWPSFRRKPESIFAFAFSPPRSDVFTPGRGESVSNTNTKGEFSGFRIRTPRNNKIVAAPPGEKSKWIPAFAGMTAFVMTLHSCLPPPRWPHTQNREIMIFSTTPLWRAFPSGPPLDLMNLNDYKAGTMPFFEEHT